MFCANNSSAWLSDLTQLCALSVFVKGSRRSNDLVSDKWFIATFFGTGHFLSCLAEQFIKSTSVIVQHFRQEHFAKLALHVGWWTEQRPMQRYGSFKKSNWKGVRSQVASAGWSVTFLRQRPALSEQSLRLVWTLCGQLTSCFSHCQHAPSTHPALGQRQFAVDQHATSQTGAAAVRKINTSLQVSESDESMFCFTPRVCDLTSDCSLCVCALNL